MTYTLGDLKTRVVAETNRDDLDTGGESVDRLTECIARACEFYSDEPFWFTNDSGTATTTASVGYVTTPFAVRIPETVSYLQQPLLKVDAASFQYLTDTGIPTQWAEDNGLIRLWPIPDGAYSLSVYGAAQLDAPTNDADETVWTNEAYDLIAARTRMLLFRDVFRDTEGAQLAAAAENEALSRLRSESRRRALTALRSQYGDPWTARGSFNINRGDF